MSYEVPGGKDGFQKHVEPIREWYSRSFEEEYSTFEF